MIRMFKGHFQQEDPEIPMALRRESVDVVFTSLLEDDQRVPEGPVPLPMSEMDGGMGFEESELGMAMDPMMQLGLDMGMDAGMDAEAGMAPGASVGPGGVPMDPRLMEG